MAAHNYISQMNVYPSQSIQNTSQWAWEPSWVAFILPELEQQAVYNAINFNLPMLEIGFVNPVPLGGMSNSTAGLLTLGSLTCPSESLTHQVSFGGDWGPSNYAGNYGGPGMISSCNGIIVPSRGDLFVSSPGLGPVSIAAVTDGTSNTAMFSEHLIGAGQGLDGLNSGYVSPYVAGTSGAKRALFQVSSVVPVPDQGAVGVTVATQLVFGCKSIPGGTAPSEDSGTGENWLFTQGYDTISVSYSHVMTPNSYSCTGGGERLLRRPGELHLRRLQRGLARRVHGHEQPPWRSQHLHGRWVGEVHQGHSQPSDVVGPGDSQSGRDHQLRPVLMSMVLARVA